MRTDDAASAPDDATALDDASVLIDRAAAIDPDADADAEEYWDLIRALHHRTDWAAFEAARAAAGSPETTRRVVGLHVLGQIAYRADRPYREQTLTVLLAASAQGGDAEVVSAAVAALGHLADPRTLPGILPHAEHPDADVRLSVASALPSGTDSDAPDDDVVQALIRLTADPDSDVRDWATFGLGSRLHADSPAIREALAARLTDPEGETPGEALVGLAARHDPRALPTVLTRLGDAPGNLIVEAAEQLADPRCLPLLVRLKEQGWAADPADALTLNAAIAACTPATTVTD